MRRRTHIQYIAHDVGTILLIVAFISLVPYLIIYWFEEWDQILSFTTVPLTFLVCGFFLSRVPYDESYTPPLSVAMLMVATLWLSSALVGSLPFIVHANFSLTDSLFEAMSGFTGTGMTLIADVAALPKTLLFWRSYMEWIGGIGIMAIGITMQRRTRMTQSFLMRSEGQREALGPNVVDTAKIFLKIYVSLTFFFSFLFLTAGISYWDALHVAMCSIGTGGFAMHSAGIAYYDNPLLETLMIPAMLCGSIPFKLYILFGIGNFTEILKNNAAKAIICCTALGSLITSADLYIYNQYPLLQAVREGVFCSVSAMTNTGFQNADLTMWLAPPILVLILLMMMSGSIGSTAGGIKVDRFILAAKGMRWWIMQYFVRERKNQRRMQYGHRIADRDAEFELLRNMVFIVMYFVVLFVAIIVALQISPPTIPLHAMVFDLVSAMSNVGLSFGYLSAESPLSLKWLYIFLMWIGRLEIVPFIILIAGLLYGFDYRVKHDVQKKAKAKKPKNRV
jgi:trk system potassium uptake protein TrkH